MIKESKVYIVQCDRCGENLITKDKKRYFITFAEIEQHINATGWVKLGQRQYCSGCFTRDGAGQPVVKPSNHS